MVQVFSSGSLLRSYTERRSLMPMDFDMRVHGEGAALTPQQVVAIQSLARARNAPAADVYGSEKPGYVRVVVAAKNAVIAPDGTVSATD